MELHALKIRGWQLHDGRILTLIFIRKDTTSDRLELLSEQYATDEADFQRIVREAQANMNDALGKAGLPAESFIRDNNAENNGPGAD